MTLFTINQRSLWFASVLLATLYASLFLATTSVSAQDPGIIPQSQPPGVAYTCLEHEHCRLNPPKFDQPNPNCSVPYGHRGLLYTKALKGTPNKNNAYVTECFDLIVNSQMQTICTTGSSDLDKQVFCPNSPDDSPTCDKYGLLRNKYASQGFKIQDDFQYTILKSEVAANSIRNDPSAPEYGVYYFENGRFQRQPPKLVSTDAAGDMIPKKIEWQSYTLNAFWRRFVLWTELSQTDATGRPQADGGGHKQDTLTFATECQAQIWDPQGIAYDIETGQPISGVKLDILYSRTSSGPYEIALAGFGEVLNVNTLNPAITSSTGYYQYFGAPGWYKMMAEHTDYEHVPVGTAINPLIARLYPLAKNHYESDGGFEEKAGQIQTKHIPMRLKAGATRPTYRFEVIEAAVIPQLDGSIKIKGRTNGPATAIVEICSMQAGVQNCSNAKRYEPGTGGPTPDNFFRFEIKESQSKLQPGEFFFLRLEQFSPTAPQAHGIMDRVMSFFSRLIPAVSAQEENRGSSVGFVIEPIPTYLEGFAYDAQGMVIPNALVGIYVSFSERPVYTTQANEQGFYRITSEYLPRDPYTVRYTDPASPTKETVTLKTSQVLAQNSEYVTLEKINPYTVVSEKSNPRAAITPSFVPRGAPAGNTGSGNTGAGAGSATQPAEIAPTGAPEAPVAQNPNGILAVIFFVILVGIAGGAAVFYIIKKRRMSE